jgi:FlaA1/EpsC-like NDP-sugar epimerase
MQRLLKIVIHIAVALGAYLAAYAFVVSPAMDWWVSAAAQQVWLLATLYASIAAILELIFRTERSSWRYVSVQDAFALLRSTFLTMAAFLLVVFVLVRGQDPEPHVTWTRSWPWPRRMG